MLRSLVRFPPIRSFHIPRSGVVQHRQRLGSYYDHPHSLLMIKRHNSTSYSDSVGRPVAGQLRRVSELQRRVAAVNSKSLKQEIIAQYPDLKELLVYVYHFDRRNHLSFSTIQKYLASNPSKPTATPPTSIEDLFNLLSSKAVSGNNAKDVVVSFLAENGVLQEEELMETFGRLLDRNLVAGFGAKTLDDVKWGDSGVGGMTNQQQELRGISKQSSATPTSDQAQTTSSSTSTNTVSSDPQHHTGNGQTPVLPNFGTLEKFEVTLGKSIEPPFDKLFSKSSTPWYASRKLDGVRCLTFLDYYVPDQGDVDEPLELISTHFVSRSGKPFFGLEKLEHQLRYLGEMPQLKQWLEKDSEVVQRRDGGVVKRLVLDGEVCVMRPKTESEKSNAMPRDDGSAVSTMWSANDPFVEDFPSTVSAMRKNVSIPHLSYFLFDVLSWAEVRAKEALRDMPGLGKKFSERIEDIKVLGGWLNERLEKEGVEEKVVKDLAQCRVSGVDEMEEMVKRAADEGWEGLILRADEGYKGKRSTDIRKFKKWQDAEYLVKSLDTSKMRLSINGIFAEHEAMSNVWIEHDGHPVSVGSGFTAEQRLRYSRNPEQIVGKMMTVEYFSESEKVGREGKRSLRFPRCKMVWEEGKREI
ncbi:hypothetical protein CI109_104490 [Kwoniella shandongensis]|uniref:Uncharacterized protein n=1 Tax=Kwoniella shandongensis TaxID=1734106 RepID=A0A5M6BV46_9TREE|nr:uncharacterized protein CI109_006809 [Kwoniella shandongensis]KAA5524859.1 hypothetical protein CI109_006809 [Kwoniella shandongensis]